MIRKLKAALSPLYYVFNPQQRWLTKQFRRTWMDKDEIIFHTLFGCIVHWVEVEGVESRSASWDEDLAAGYVTQQYVDEKRKIEDKITEIYLWHTNDRKLLEADAQKLLDNSIDLLQCNSGASRSKIYKAIRKIQDKVDKQDQIYMKEIVKLSGYLWS
jgi:hypothetical protein